MGFFAKYANTVFYASELTQSLIPNIQILMSFERMSNSAQILLKYYGIILNPIRDIEDLSNLVSCPADFYKYAILITLDINLFVLFQFFTF